MSSFLYYKESEVALMAKLTANQKLFCDEYLIDLNATQAAIRSGYSNSYANKKAFLLLEKPHIKAYIAEKMKVREKRTEITQDLVLEELRNIALAKPTDFFEVEDMGQYKRVNIKPTKDIPEDRIGAISSIKQGANGIEVKLYDRVRVLELLGRHLGIFKDKVEVSGNINNPYEGLSTDDLKKLINGG